MGWRSCETLAAACALTVLLPSCSESPGKAVKRLGEAAARRNLVQFRERFTPDSIEDLRREWRESGQTEGEGWLDLMTGYLGDNAKAPDVVSEELQGEDRAVVKVNKETRDGKTVTQDLALARQDGRWRLVLSEMQYAVGDAGAGKDKADKKGKKKKKKAPLSGKDDDVEPGPAGSGDGAKERKIEDFDLENY